MFAPGGIGTRMSAFDVDGFRVTVTPKVDCDLNEAAFLLACRFARDGAELKTRIAELEAECAGLRRRVPPARPQRLLGIGCVRQQGDALWLLSEAAKGWRAFGYRFDSWDQLLRAWDVEVGAPQQDEHGWYWSVSNRGQQTLEQGSVSHG